MKRVVALAALSLAACAPDQLEQCARATSLEAEAIERATQAPGHFSKGETNVALVEASMRSLNAAVRWREKVCSSE